MPRKRQVTTTEVFEDGERGGVPGLAREALETVPLFEAKDGDESHIAFVHVVRIDPPEGFLGKLEPESTEGDILAKWGGGEFRIQGKNEQGKVVRSRQITLAGDPLFISRVFEARWRRQNGLPALDGSATDGAQAGSLGMRDMLTLMMTMQQRSEETARLRDEERRREEERREDNRRREEERAEVRRREDERAREQLRLDEQKRREDAERNERERERQAQLAQQQQTQQFMATMTGVLTAQLQAAQQQAATAMSGKPVGADPIAVLMQGIELANKLRPESSGKDEEGGGQDPIAALISKIPEMISEARETALAFRGQGGGEEAEGEDEGHAETGEQAAERMVIEGATAVRFKAVVAKLVREGKDPEKVLNAVAEAMLQPRPPRQLGPKRVATAPMPAAPLPPKATPGTPAAPAAAVPAPRADAPKPASSPAAMRTAAALAAQQRLRAVRAAAARAHVRPAPAPAPTPASPTTEAA